VAHYRAYIIGRDGQFQSAIDLDCANDDTASESAKQLLSGYDVELWQWDRKMATFESKEP